MVTTNEILDRLEGLTFAEAAEELGIFSSYERPTALVVVMARAPTAIDRIRVFLQWGNLCDAPWWNRSLIADMLRHACAEVSMPDMLEPADRRFYDMLPGAVEVWRGCEQGRERGLSWTTDRAIAAEFAQGKRCSNRKPTLVRAKIPKEHSIMAAVTALTDRFDRALLYATHVHGGQVRKETTIPYVAHLLAVAATVLEYGGSEDMAIAELLHDAVEGQSGEPPLTDIRNRFGDRVADIVHACSDSVTNTAAGQQKEDWRTRKMRYIEHLKTIDRETRLVSLSDKVHNARSILRDLRKPEIGAAVWDRFGKRPKEDTLLRIGKMPFKFCCQANLPKNDYQGDMAGFTEYLKPLALEWSRRVPEPEPRSAVLATVRSVARKYSNYRSRLRSWTSEPNLSLGGDKRPIHHSRRPAE